MDRPTQSLWRHQAWILLAAGLVFFTNLGAAALFDEDEPKNAVCGREMFLRGDWLVPTFNDELRTDKPILIYWLILTSFSVWGVNEFAARLGSAVLAVATSLLTYHLGRKLFHPEVGLWAGLVLCTSLMFAAVGRAVTPDATLIACTTAAFLAYVWAVADRHGGVFGLAAAFETHRRWEEYVPLTIWRALPMYAAMGLAVLAKGPIGVLLPCAIVGMNLLVQQQLNHRRNRVATTTMRPLWQRVLLTVIETFHPIRIWRGIIAMHAPVGLLLTVAIALPWYIAVGVATNGAWLEGFLGGHNVSRFLAPMENHSGPIVYYVPVIMLGCLPWSVFVPLAAWQARRQLQGSSLFNPGLIFAVIWLGIWVGFFSLAKTKLPNYVLPSYPALALLLGNFLYQWQRDATTNGLAFRNACRVLAALGAALLIGFPLIASMFLPQESWVALAGAIPLLAAGMAYSCSLRQQRRLAVKTLCVAAVSLAVLLIGIAPSRIARHQDGPTFGKLIQALPTGHDAELATFDYFAPNLVFYAERHVHRLRKAEQVTAFFDEHPNALLLTRDDRLDQITNVLPPGITVLASHPRFLRRHRLVLLGHGPQAILPAGHSVIR